jgi:hypothetical protein
MGIATPQYDFDERLRDSKGRRLETDLEPIKGMLHGCISVAVAPLHLDRAGVDYIATLRGGATVSIDAKNRQRGCSKRWGWPKEPQLALEKWSVMPGGLHNTPKECAVVGWALDESKKTDYVLFKFHPSDTPLVYLLPFQLLRVAFFKNIKVWWDVFFHHPQNSVRNGSEWQSECVFVPAETVCHAIYEASISTQCAATTPPPQATP